MVGNIFMEHDLISNDFWYKIKMYNFDPYNVLLSYCYKYAPDWFCAPGSHL